MAAASDRMAWLDVARGAAMLLVILTHAFAAVQTVAEPWRPLALANYALATVRMPLFFFCAGLLAHWGLAKPWGTVLRRRVWVLLWAYAIWTLLTFAVASHLPLLPWAPRPPEAATLLWAPYGNEWFLYALILLTLFARALRPLPMAGQAAATLAAIAALHVWAAGGTDPLAAADVPLRLSDYALGAFMLGVWMAPWVVAALARPGAVRAAFVGGAALWLGAMGLRMADLEPPTLVSALPGMAAALALSTWLAAVGPLRRALGWVGRRTLEIFLAHQAFVALGLAAATALGLGPNAALAWVFAAATAGAIGYAALAEAGPLRRLTRPPAPARRAAAGAAA